MARPYFPRNTGDSLPATRRPHPHAAHEGMLVACVWVCIPLPQMPPIEALQRKREYCGGIWFMIEIDPSRLMSGAKRVNITLPERLLTQIDRAAAAENTSRSGFLAEAALARLAGISSASPAGRKTARTSRKN